MRKIIQIATDSLPDSESWDGWVRVTALCDDGTVWELEHHREEKVRKWTKVPAIPQDAALLRPSERLVRAHLITKENKL